MRHRPGHGKNSDESTRLSAVEICRAARQAGATAIEIDPAALTRELLSRCVGFHFRNHRADKVPTQTLSEGVMDLHVIAAAIVERGYAGWGGLELWHREDATVTRSMADCQAESIGLLRELFG